MLPLRSNSYTHKYLHINAIQDEEKEKVDAKDSITTVDILFYFIALSK